MSLRARDRVARVEGPRAAAPRVVKVVTRGPVLGTLARVLVPGGSEGPQDDLRGAPRVPRRRPEDEDDERGVERVLDEKRVALPAVLDDTAVPGPGPPVGPTRRPYDPPPHPGPKYVEKYL